MTNENKNKGDKRNGKNPIRIVKKKVKAYPFPGTLEQNGIKTEVEIVYVSALGFMAELKSKIVFVGTYYQVQFQLPVLRTNVFTLARVLKTYDKAQVEKDHMVERIAEFHFEKLSDDHKSNINGFTRALGQK